MTPDQLSRPDEGSILLTEPLLHGVEETYIPLPKPSAARSRPQADRLNSILIGLTLLFAFLASSFAVSDSAVWSHLASGRTLIHRPMDFDAQPLAGPHDGTNPSWLFDAMLYLLYRVVGGGGLIVVQALLIAALAWLLLRLPRSDHAGGWPAACVLLVLLILSPQLSLQPGNLSYLFLALALWLLVKPRPIEEQSERVSFRRDLKRFWLLPILVAVWSNVDNGFFLGLLLVGLFWLGERLECLSQAQRSIPPRLTVWLPLACLGACLLNPHHIHVLTLPPELSPGAVAADDEARRFLSSPWQWGRKDGPVLAEAAYFVLIGLGLLSFILNRRRLSGWRLSVWLGFALLSAWRTGLLPFFAVVAGPIAALNMQEFLNWCREVRMVGRAERDQAARRGGSRSARPTLQPDHSEAALSGRSGRRLDWSGLARVLLLAPALGLVLLAGAGRLRGMHGEQRPVCWRVQVDPSLQRLAETMETWRQQGRLHKGERLLAFHPSVAHYCAWFSPAVELRCPQRFPSRADAEVFAEARRELGCPVDGEACSHLLREWSVAYTIAEDAETRDELLENPQQWLLADVAGRAAIFTWRSGGLARNDLTPFDAERLAFAPFAEDRDAPSAPAQGAGRGPTPPSFWSSLRPAPASSWETEAAAAYLRCFQKETLPRYSRRWLISWSAFAASLIGLPSSAAPATTGNVSLLARLHNPSTFLADIDRDLPAFPLLAVRAARRALAANPDDAQAYLRLGQAYFALWEETGEKPLSQGNTLLLELRHVQIAAALEQAVLRDPDCIPAHRLLVRLYLQRAYLDAALDHLRAELRLVRQTGPRRGEDSETFQGRLDGLERQVRNLESAVEQRQTRLTASSHEDTADPVRRATTALALGLARHALENILQPVPPVLLESRGLQLELQLMLRLGRVEQLRDSMLDPQWQKDQANLGWLALPAPRVTGYPHSYRLPFYAWTRLCWAAAVGDYHRVEDQLQDLLELVRTRDQQQAQLFRISLARAVTTEVALSSLTQSMFLQPVLQDGRLLVMSSLSGTLSFQGDQADLFTLGGLLAVERGLPSLAEHHLEQACQLCRSEEGAAQDFSTRALAENYLQRIQRSTVPRGR